MIDDKQDQANGDQVIASEISDPAQPVHVVGSLRGSPKYLPGKGSGIKRARGARTFGQRAIRLTDERKALILTYLRRGSHLETAFAAAGIPGATFRGWMTQARDTIERARLGGKVTERRKALVRFLADVETAQAQFEQRMINVVAGAADAGTYTAALALLERRFPDRWSKRDDQAAPVNVNVGFSFVQVSGDPNAQRLTDERSDDQPGDTPITASDRLIPASTDAPQDIV